MVAITFKSKAWYDKAYVCVSAESGSEVQLRTKTTSLNITGGNFDVEGIETFGGKVKRVGAREDIEIGFDGIAKSHQDFDWIFHGKTTNTDTSITSSSVKDYRVILLWTDQSGVTDAAQAITTASEAYRELYAECNLVSLEKSMDAGEHLTAAITFKTTFVDDSDVINFKKEACGTGSALDSASAYTSTNKF